MIPFPHKMIHLIFFVQQVLKKLNSKGVSYVPAKANMSDPCEEPGEVVSTARYKAKDWMETASSDSSGSRDISILPYTRDDIQEENFITPQKDT
jgi:hypothetical protein